MRREAAVDRRLEPRHVEEHVDRDHHDEHDREEQEDDRERGVLRERDRVLGVPGDVAGADRVGEVVELLLDLDPFQTVVVEPALEPVDVDLRAGLTGGWAVLGEIDVDPVRGGARLGEDDGAERDEKGDERRGEDDRDDRHREPAREAQAREVADERVEREGDHGRGQEQEQDVSQRPREEEREEEQHGQDDELDPAWDPDRRRLGHAAIVALPLSALDAGREPGFPVRYRGADGLAALPASGSSP